MGHFLTICNTALPLFDDFSFLRDAEVDVGHAWTQGYGVQFIVVKTRNYIFYYVDKNQTEICLSTVTSLLGDTISR